MLRFLPLVLLIPALQAQTFEAASIRPAAPLGADEQLTIHGGPGTSDPERISYRAVALRDLIAKVYGVAWLQLTIPEQFQFKLRYDIVAKIAPGTTKEQFNTMMQNLLADRFGMKFHRQPKQFDAYKLVVAKGGPNLMDTTFKSDSYAADTSKRPVRRDPDGAIFSPGTILSVHRNGQLVISGGKLTTRRLADNLESELRGPVTDATGLSGEYDIKIVCSPVGLAMSGTPARAVDSPSDPAPKHLPSPRTATRLEAGKIDRNARHAHRRPLGRSAHRQLTLPWTRSAHMRLLPCSHSDASRIEEPLIVALANFLAGGLVQQIP